jgi:uncharacterized coiled-coil protein SlyX
MGLEGGGDRPRRETGVPRKPEVPRVTARESEPAERILRRPNPAVPETAPGQQEYPLPIIVRSGDNKPAGDPASAAFGNTLKELTALVEAKGLPRGEQANLFNVDRSTLLRRLSGTTVPDETEVQRMIDAVATRTGAPVETDLIERIREKHAEASEVRRPGLRELQRELTETQAQWESISRRLAEAEGQVAQQRQVIDELVRALATSRSAGATSGNAWFKGADADRQEQELLRELAQAVEALDAALASQRESIDDLRKCAVRLMAAGRAYIVSVVAHS